jgi:chemotaxis protein MotB
MKKKKQESHGNAERWMLSYADFMTLLMILFVVLYAMSNVDKAKFTQLSQSMSIAMGGGKIIEGSQSSVNIDPTSNPTSGEAQAEAEESKMKDLKDKVDKYLEKNGMKDSTTTEIDERGLVVSLNDTLFFDTGRAEIKPDSQGKLIEIAKILNQVGNNMRIEGHTDNVPIKNDQFSSNWQLSCARAANVTQLLIDNSGIDPQKLSAVGYGQYKPVLDNATEEGRARNRRVDIIIVNSKFNKMENNSIGNNPIGDKPIGDKPIGDNPLNVPNAQ